ncbi:MAG: PAS domain S-box protein, partial [Syntrophales bacterium]|nr:PAS domain S-box protein [Syntrophales bacterium]
IHPDFISYFDKEWERMLNGYVEPFYEYMIIDRTGATRWMQQKNVLIRDEAGQPIFLEGIVIDITQRKQAEEESRKSRGFLSDLIEHSGALICIKDLEGRYELVNRKWEEVTRLKRQDVIGKTDEELFPGPIGRQFRRNDLEVMESGSVLEKEEILEDEKGNRFFISIKFPLRDGDGVVGGICAMITEITARKEVEAELGVSRNRLSRAEIISRSGNWEFDMKSSLVMASDGAHRIYGLPDSPWSIPDVQKMPLPEYRGMLDHALRGLIDENRPYDVEFKIRRPDTGEVVDIHSVAEYDRHRKVVFGIIQDITEHKRAKSQLEAALDALGKSESLMRAITDSAQDAILMMEPSGCISFWNPAAEHIFGYTNKEAIGRDLHQFLAPKRFIEAYHAAFDRFKTNGQGEATDRTIELQACRKNGEEFPIELSLSAIKLEDSWHAVGIIRDITARKQAEQKLRESEELYRTFINATSDMVFLKDELFHNIVVNKSMASFFGKPEEEIIGKSDFELMPQIAAEKCRQTDLESVTNASIITSEEIVGDHVYETHKFPVNLGPNMVGVGGFIRNISARKRTEEELDEYRRRLEDIIEFLPDATLVIDREGKVIAWNRAIESMTGVRKADMLGKGSYEYALPFYGKRRPMLIDYAAHPEKEMEKQYTAIQRVGEIIFGEAIAPNLPPGDIHLYATASVLHDSRGNIIAAIECVRDNTERKKLAERLNRAEKMEGLGRLAGGVAHDLNNILGVLVGYSELLGDCLPTDGPLRKYADNILQAGLRGAAIIQDLLTLARRGVAVSEVVDLNRIVGDYLKTPEFEQLRLEHLEVKVRIDLTEGLLNVKGSPVHLSKTLMNLVSNAAEAISGPGEITIKTENRYLDIPVQGYDDMREGDYAVLTVSDTGKGIPVKDIGKIFEPFYTKKVMGRSGTGLGLA